MKEKNLCNLKSLICVICAFNMAFVPKVVGKVREGNKLYEKEDYDEALKKYTDAQIDRPESPELFFNIGDILYRQRKYSEAEAIFEKAIPRGDTQLEAKIYYNIGDCKYRQGQLRESLDYYKKALELNPNDEDAKYNIEFVEKKIKEMLSQAKEQQKKQGEKGEDTEEKTKQETQQVEEAAKGETQPQEQKPEEDREGAKPEELSKEEAEALLRMMADEEKNAGKPEDRTRRRPGYYPETDKPW